MFGLVQMIFFCRDEKAPIKASYSQKFIKELTEKKQEEMRESVEATNKLR